MPESFAVDIRKSKDDHWPPPEHHRTHVIVDDDEEEEMEIVLPPLPIDPLAEDHHRHLPVAGGFGHTHEDDSNHFDKRAPPFDRIPPPHVDHSEPSLDQDRQGPPFPDSPHSELNFDRTNAKPNLDPEVEKIAKQRQDQNRYTFTRPLSFHGSTDKRYILRPEAIESVFYMYRITGDPTWQEKGWKMWQSIEAATWTELAYSAILDVFSPNSNKADSMER
jgi:Glycosyl hydrolase family 47